MMSNGMPERKKETLTGCVSFYTQWIDMCVCIRVCGLHLVGMFEYVSSAQAPMTISHQVTLAVSAIWI